MLRNKGGQLLRDRKPTQITRKAKTRGGQAQDTQVDFSYKRAAVGERKNPKITELQMRNWMLNVGAAADGRCVYILTVELYNL